MAKKKTKALEDLCGLSNDDAGRLPAWLKCEDCGNTDPKQFTYKVTVTELRPLRFDEPTREDRLLTRRSPSVGGPAGLQ